MCRCAKHHNFHVHEALTECEQGFYGDVAKLFIGGITQCNHGPDALHCLQTDREAIWNHSLRLYIMIGH